MFPVEVKLMSGDYPNGGGINTVNCDLYDMHIFELRKYRLNQVNVKIAYMGIIQQLKCQKQFPVRLVSRSKFDTYIYW